MSTPLSLDIRHRVMCGYLWDIFLIDYRFSVSASQGVNNHLKLTRYLHLKLTPLYESKPAGELPSYSEFAGWLCLRWGLLFLALFTLSEAI